MAECSEKREQLDYLNEDDLKALHHSSNCCIYKVPKKLRAAGGDRYDPHVVYIGPYQDVFTKKNLEVTEKHKKYYLKYFIDGSSTDKFILPDMIREITNIEDDARSHYTNSFTLTKEEFRNMLILDGCFIIGVLYRGSLQKDHDWRSNDILFSNKSIVCSIRRDLVLLENQLPYCVLEVLYKLIAPPIQGFSEKPELKELIMEFFDPILPGPKSVFDSATEGKHILDILRQHLITVEDKTRGNVNPRGTNEPTKDATMITVHGGTGGGVHKPWRFSCRGEKGDLKGYSKIWQHILDILRQHLIFLEDETRDEVRPSGTTEESSSDATIIRVHERISCFNCQKKQEEGIAEEGAGSGVHEAGAGGGVDEARTETDKADINKISCFNCLKKKGSQKGWGKIWQHTTCATDLQEAGVKFRKKVTNKGLLDITFNSKEGKFEIPSFYFGESWTVLFPNMIALEQCHGAHEDRITSYVRLMDNLVDSRSDVKVLYDQGIITGMSKEFETIANDINNLCKDAVYENFFYDEMCKEVNKYRMKWHHRWRAYFVRNYWHSPWGFVSLIGAIILLALAIIQTILSGLAWKYPVN